MNRLSKSIAILAATFALAACTKVPNGNVGVKFDLYGGDKGVTGEIVGPGKYWLGWNEEMYLFPTFTQTAVWKKGVAPLPNEEFSFQDKEGTTITADVGMSYSIESTKADLLFKKFRKGIDEITDTYVYNIIRDSINQRTSKLDVTEIYGAEKDKIIAAVTTDVQAQLKPIGINLERIYWVSALRLPANITTAINAKIEATQKAMQRENELQTAKAQAEIEREKARGEADAQVIAASGQAKANALVAQSITPTLIDYHNAQRWDGKLPTMMGSSAVPFINVK